VKALARSWQCRARAVLSSLLTLALLLGAVECKAKPLASSSQPPAPTGGAIAAKSAVPDQTAATPVAGISAGEASLLAGTWEVEHVGVNMADQPHWKWLPNDPQLMGRELVVGAAEIRFADFKEANCKPATWRKKTYKWKDLEDELFAGPASKQTPAEFRVKAPAQAKVQVFEPCALIRPGHQLPGNNWALGSWVVPIAPDKLIMEFDSDSVLYLSRRSATPKPSFDCAKATTATEKAICSDANLAAWDRSVALAWKRQRERDGGVDSTIKAKHTAWLRTRDACGADVACLATTMRDHTSYLVGR
jgi:hypothetical protein